MNGKLQVHGHCNGLKTTLLFALMWGVIMLIWWATGASQSTLGYYILIGLTGELAGSPRTIQDRPRAIGEGR